MKFKGDIIITDPCYIAKDNDDWFKCETGENMEALGFDNYITSDTLYGDWSCTTYQYDIGHFDSNDILRYEPIKEIGNFCADAGMVGVFLLEEVLKYNPNFDYHITKPWTTTLIKDFDGTVRFELMDDGFEDDEKQLVVVGKGNINFLGYQTGF